MFAKTQNKKSWTQFLNLLIAAINGCFFEPIAAHPGYFFAAGFAGAGLAAPTTSTTRRFING